MWIYCSAETSWLVKSQITHQEETVETWVGFCLFYMLGAGCCLAGLCPPGPWGWSDLIGPVFGNSKWLHWSRTNLNLLHAQICLFLSPLSSLVFAISIFREVCPFVRQTNDHKGQVQAILECFTVLSKYRLIFLCHPQFQSVNCRPKGSVKEG